MTLCFATYIRQASFCAFLALLVLLSAPFSASCQLPARQGQQFFISTGCCGGCPAKQAGTAEHTADGCCAVEHCCNACCAPLATPVQLPAIAPPTGCMVGFEPLLKFPEVYLPIFVPPESRS